MKTEKFVNKPVTVLNQEHFSHENKFDLVLTLIKIIF